MKSSLFPLLLTLLCLTLAPRIYADQPLPPSFLTAISDQDGKVPLFWFKPNPDICELVYDDSTMDYPINVGPDWYQNCFAVKMTSPKTPFFLLKSRIFISYKKSQIDPAYNYQAPFFVTVNKDSGGIPRNTYLDSALAWATGEDTVEHDGEWVEIEHDLLMIGAYDFWIVFHWLEGSPMSPIVGGDNSTNQRRSFWGMKKSPHFEWHERSDFNIMIRALIVTNGDDSCEVDSFKIYRSDSSVSISDTNLLVSVPSVQFQYVDTNVNNNQTYFYKLISHNAGNESDASNEVSATPKKGAVLITDQNLFQVNLGSKDTAFEYLTLTNSGGLPLEFKVEIDMEEDSSWMGGSNKFGYTWTDKNHQDEFGYSWVDITDRGTSIGTKGDDNENYGFFRLNFSFPFYGNFFDSLRISSNGWISFTDTTGKDIISYLHKPLPYLWGPYNLIAPLWDDLKFKDSSKIYFYSNDDSVFICFSNLFRYSPSGGGPYTFQTILTKNGEIAFQYHRINDTLYRATVGIQNQDGTNGLGIFYNQKYLKDSLWIRIRPSWVSVDSMWGTIQPGENKTLNLIFDRLSYPRGIYHANLIINSRDKNHDLDTIRIPLTLCIDTTTSVDFDEDQKPTSFALFQNYPNPFNPSTKIPFTVHGSQFMVHRPIHTTLKIYNILGQKVRTLVDEPKTAGSYEVIWDGKDDKGKDVASGIYFYQLTAGKYKETKKMVLIR